jgi:hypothetical protein
MCFDNAVDDCIPNIILDFNAIDNSPEQELEV